MTNIKFDGVRVLEADTCEIYELKTHSGEKPNKWIFTESAYDEHNI